jgi:hypothetical protein
VAARNGTQPHLDVWINQVMLLDNTALQPTSTSLRLSRPAALHHHLCRKAFPAGKKPGYVAGCCFGGMS